MSVYVTYLFYGAIFLSVLLLVEGLFYLLSGPGGGAASPNRRLRMLVSGVKREDVMVRLQRERPLPSGDHARNPVEWFIMLVAQSGVSMSPQRILLVMVIVGGVAAAIMMLAFRSAIAAGLGAAAVGFIGPLLVLMLNRRRRLKAMTRQLPDAIEI